MKIRKSRGRSLFTLVEEIAEKYNLEVRVVSELLKQSIKTSFLKEYPDNIIDVFVDLDDGKIEIWRELQVVTDEFYKNEGFEDEETLIPISRVSELPETPRNPAKAKVGDLIYKEVNIEDLDAKITTNIQFYFKKLTQNEISKSICQRWSDLRGKVLEGVVEEFLESRDDRSLRKIIVSVIGQDGTTAKGIISKNDLIWQDTGHGSRIYENLSLGKTYLFYIKEVSETNTKFPITLSRTDPEIVKYLMEKHVSEIAEGLVEIKGISRIAGVKTKVWVHSKNPNIDSVGCCIGPKVKRLKIISSEILNEKIDVILWNEDPVQNVINSFAAGKIIGYRLDPNEENSITLIATTENLLSCIGKRGTNIKLVYMLTNWKINLKTIQEAKEEKIDYISIDDDKFTNNNKISERIFKMHFKKSEDILQSYYDSKKSINSSEEVLEDESKKK